MKLLFEDFELDAARRELRHGEVTHRPAHDVFTLLHLLASNSDRAVSKDEIVSRVWPDAKGTVGGMGAAGLRKRADRALDAGGGPV